MEEIKSGNQAYYNQHIHLFTHKLDTLEQKVNEIEQLYLELSKNKRNDASDRERHVPSLKMLHQDAATREAAAAKRMRDLVRHFATILRQITMHKWAWPFMNPVDVEGLGLHDYYEIIEKPMDFNTIKAQMEAKDGTGYKNVREICADVRLIFENAMKYNDEKHDVHAMAKGLLEKFEEKWLQFVPKVTEEEKRLEKEEARAQLDLQLAQEAVHVKMASDVSNELHEVDMQLDGFREMVVQKCRKISAEEKRKLGEDLIRLSHEDLSRALEIIAQNNQTVHLKSEEVVLDIDAQSESTLWRLKVLVNEALETPGKSSADKSGKNILTKNDGPNNAKNNKQKRERELCGAIAKTAKKKSHNTS